MTDIQPQLPVSPPFAVMGVIGSHGTIFLTPSVILSQLKDGEHVTGMSPVSIMPSDEFLSALRELQRQHSEMSVFLQTWMNGDDEMDDAYNDMLDGWSTRAIGGAS